MDRRRRVAKHGRITAMPGLTTLLAATALSSFSLSAMASPQSQDFTAQGETELTAGHGDAAIQKAQAAVEADATDAGAQFLLGRAYFSVGQDTKAVAAFNEAVKLDPQLTARAAVYRGLIALRHKDQAALQQSYQDITQGSPNSSLAQRLESLRTQAAANQAATPPQIPGTAGSLSTPGATGAARAPLTLRNDPFQLSASVGVGYNDNALFLGDNIRLSSNSDRKSSAFVNFTVDALYNWRRSNGDGFDVGYSFNGDFYKDIPDVNLADHTLFADYRHAFNGRTSGSVRVSDNFTTIGGERYRNQIAISPALTFRHSLRAFTQLSYDLAFNDYKIDNGPDEQNRDSTSHTLSLAHYFTPGHSRAQFRGGVYYQLNQAKGDDYDFHSAGIFAGVRHPLPWNITGDLSYTYSWDRYEHDNSLSDPAFSEKRRDNVNAVSLQLSRPVKSTPKYGLDAYVRYTYNHDNSNLDFFNYRQNIVMVGLGGQF